MTDLPSRDEAQRWAISTARDIVMREGAALMLSTRDLDEAAIEADSTLLGVAIAEALMRAFDHDLTVTS